MPQRHALTDDQWNQIRDLLPGKKGDPGRTAEDNRLFVDAILFVAKTGIPWRDLPERFGKWNSVWKRFDRLSKAGVFEAFFDTLASMSASAHLIQMFDSTVIRAHVSAAGAKGGSRVRRSAARAVGSPRKSMPNQMHREP